MRLASTPPGLLILIGLALLTLEAGCGLFPRGTKESRERESDCARAVQVVTRDELMARPHRTLRTVSASCSRRRDCVKALVNRACELQADAVFVHNTRVVSAVPQRQPDLTTYVTDPQDKVAGANTWSPGPGTLFGAEGQLVVWGSN